MRRCAPASAVAPPSNADGCSHTAEVAGKGCLSIYNRTAYYSYRTVRLERLNGTQTTHAYSWRLSIPYYVCICFRI
eukprot:271301-Pleurochrysis_carterae.AAC.2